MANQPSPDEKMAALTARLSDPSEYARRKACEDLGEMGDPRAVEPLISRLADTDGYVREAACRALGKSGDLRAVGPLISLHVSSLASRVTDEAAKALIALGRGSVDALISQLAEPDSRPRQLACWALGRLGDPRAAEPLLWRLGDADWSVRATACRALGALGEERLASAVFGALEGETKALDELAQLVQEGDQHAVEVLISSLGNGWWMHEKACAALLRLGDPRAVEPLISCLADSNNSVRHVTCRTLGGLGDPRAVEPLISRLADPEWLVRTAACDALGWLGDPRAVEPLISRLSDSVSRVGCAACAALGSLADSRAVEPLLSRLGDSSLHWDALEAASDALGKLGDPQAVEPLIARLRSPDDLVRRFACRALGGLGGPRAVEPLISRLADPAQNVRDVACEALGRLGDPRAVEPLISRLADSERGVRFAAWRALCALEEGRLADAVFHALDTGKPEALSELARLREKGDLRAFSPLVSALADTSLWVRERASAALGSLGDPRAVAPLISGLADPESWVRKTVSAALGKLGDPQAVEPLMARLADADSDVRRAATQALGRLGDSRPVKPLAACLGDSDSKVRQAAGEALHALGQGRIADAVSGAVEGKPEAAAELARLAREGFFCTLEPLIVRLKDPDAKVREAAAEALGTVAKQIQPLLGVLVCGSCFARLERRTATVDAGPQRRRKTCWFACRVCGQARDVLAGVTQVIAVLDEDWRGGPACDGGVLRVNWLERRALCDFDAVEIRRASDYEVERFCIAVGNDTDERRRARTQKATCVVAPECRLPDNTLRILRSMFRER